MKHPIVLSVFGIIIGISGLVIVGVNAGWHAAGGVFLMVFGDNLTKFAIKK